MGVPLVEHFQREILTDKDLELMDPRITPEMVAAAYWVLEDSGYLKPDACDHETLVRAMLVTAFRKIP